MTVSEKELAAALAKIRKEHDLVKFADEFHHVSEMSFQRAPLVDKLIPYVEKDVVFTAGVPFLWEGPAEMGCPELFLLKPKSSDYWYVLAPLENPIVPDLVECELEVAHSMLSDDDFPMQVADQEFHKDQMAFVHIPELEELLLEKPDAKKKLKFNGLPITVCVTFGKEADQVNLIVCGSQHDGKLYILTPIIK